MKHLRKQIAGYLLTLILLMAGFVFPGSGEKGSGILAAA